MSSVASVFSPRLFHTRLQSICHSCSHFLISSPQNIFAPFLSSVFVRSSPLLSPLIFSAELFLSRLVLLLFSLSFPSLVCGFPVSGVLLVAFKLQSIVCQPLDLGRPTGYGSGLFLTRLLADFFSRQWHPV